MTDRTFDQALKESIERIAESEVFVDLYHPSMADFEKDPVPALQLAIAILLDKPIVLAVPVGREPPAKLLAIADHIIRGGPEQIAEGLRAYMDAKR